MDRLPSEEQRGEQEISIREQLRQWLEHAQERPVTSLQEKAL